MNARAKSLLLTARPKTLTAAVVPIIVATALARAEGHATTWWISICALLSAIMIQIGTNFVNDALDFVKGADGETRLGDARASQSGWFSHRAVMLMGIGCFAVAMALGVPLVWLGGWPILIIGCVSLVLGYAYTGGPLPLAYVGLGDLFVILFFGLVAVGGVYYLQTGAYSTSAAVAGLQVGLLATVLIAINNLRDLGQDRLVNKRTLAVRLGPKLGRWEVPALFVGAFALNVFWITHGHPYGPVATVLLVPLAFKVTREILTKPPGREYNLLLAKASMIHMLFGLGLSIGLCQS